MKLNKVTIICLSLALVLTAGIFVVRAAGFVSYEDDPNSPKLYFWDNVRMITHGLKMSPTGVADAEDVPGGTIKIIDKDLFVRGFVGFGCNKYPLRNQCQAAIGNIGNSFLSMDQVSSDGNLEIKSVSSDINLGLTNGNLMINGKLILSGDLFVSSKDALPSGGVSAGSNVLVDKLYANEFTDTDAFDSAGLRVGLNVSQIWFGKVTTESPTVPIVFYPKRNIYLDLINH